MKVLRKSEINPRERYGERRFDYDFDCLRMVLSSNHMKHELEEHKHDNLYELIFVIRGKIKMVCIDAHDSRSCIELKDNDAALLEPGDMHKIEVFQDNGSEFIAIKFKPDEKFVGASFSLLVKSDWTKGEEVLKEGK